MGGGPGLEERGLGEGEGRAAFSVAQRPLSGAARRAGAAPQLHPGSRRAGPDRAQRLPVPPACFGVAARKPPPARPTRRLKFPGKPRATSGTREAAASNFGFESAAVEPRWPRDVLALSAGRDVGARVGKPEIYHFPDRDIIL